MSAHYYVYVLFDYRGVPRYVGKGQGRRWLRHEEPDMLEPRTYKTNFIKKTLRLLSEVPKVKVRENLTEDEAYKIEVALIAAIGRYPNGSLVNATDGGDGVRNPSEEARRKIGDAHRDKPMPENVRRALSKNWVKGRIFTEEHRQNVSQAMLGKKKSPEAIAKSAAARTGAKRSEEARRKMSERAKQRYASPEARRSLSERGVMGATARWGVK